MLVFIPHIHILLGGDPLRVSWEMATSEVNPKYSQNIFVNIFFEHIRQPKNIFVRSLRDHFKKVEN